MGQTLFKSGPVVFKSAEICLLKMGRVVFYSRASCLLKRGELSSKSGASCLGASFMWVKLSWGELSLGRVVLIPLIQIQELLFLPGTGSLNIRMVRSKC